MRFVTIGTSPITDKFIAGASHDPAFELYGVYSRSADRASALARRHGARMIFTALEDVASDPRVDAVYIASPNSLHAYQSSLMLTAKKAVLCEKPAASNRAELEQVVSLSRSLGVLYMEAYMPMFMPNYTVFKQAVRRLGRIEGAEFSFCRYSSRYDAYKRGEQVNTFKREFSNGAVMDMGPYCVYPAVDLFGLPRRVSARGRLMDTGVDAECRAVLEYDGFDVYLHCAKTFTSPQYMSVHGSDGYVLADNPNIPSDIRLGLSGDETDISAPQLSDCMYYEAREFIRLFNLGRIESDANTHRLSLAVLSVIDEIRRQTGVVFDADTHV